MEIYFTIFVWGGEGLNCLKAFEGVGCFWKRMDEILILALDHHCFLKWIREGKLYSYANLFYINSCLRWRGFELFEGI